MIGTKLGPYEIREKIGSGGMATVYRAHQASMDRHVAVKVIHANILHDEVLRDRFEREARLIARLEHPHLLPVYDFNGSHNPPHIVMRYLEGGTLKQVMSTGRLPYSEILYMLRQVAAALDYAHRQGVVHRDLKPSNIMIDREGNAFIADFGIARIADATEDLTGTGVLVGTPGYMAPEQARGNGEIDSRSDIYSLGVTVFEMLSGRAPFERDSNLDVLMAHVQDPVPSICQVNPELPAALEPVIQRAMAKQKDERYPTAGSLVDGLCAALEVEAVSEPTQIQAMTETISLERLAAHQAAEAARATGDDPTATGETASEQQRQMTALYLDVTELSEILYERGAETETVREVMDRLWGRFREIAEAGDGVLQSRTDEVGVMLWGMERTREDDAERAIRAALDIQSETIEETRRQLGKRWEPGEETPLPFLAGITTGPVLLERESQSGSFAASGATITLAGRLKDAAPAGEVLVSHDAYTQVRGVFDFQQHQPIRVRGQKGMLEVYVAQRARPRAFRLQARGIEGIETRMIGREIELRLLQEALTLTIEDRETQVVTVVGEAGVGKSRLLFEFSNWIDLLDERLWFFQARATQPSMLQPYSLTRDLFSFRFQILDSDPLDVVHEKFVDGVEGFMGEGTAEKAELIGHLVGFDFSNYPAVAAALLDPDGFRKEALTYLGQFFLSATQENPIVIQIEDIHWADDRSLDLISNLVRENTQLPVFVICMSRPSLYQRRPQWGEGQRFHARIQLEPLSLLSSRRLVKELLKKVAEVPTELRDLIIDRADGNPFYIEELIKALIDDGVIVKGDEEWNVDTTRLSSVRIPPTLTGVLQSRLDTLPAGVQQLLQRAAVVGRVFWDAAAMRLSTADGVTAGTVTAILDDLREREMVFLREESGFEGASEYVFRHAILRDVTYQTIVPRQRRIYHRRVADWLLEAGGERANELTLLVAEHYELAQEPALAAEQLKKAAQAAFDLGVLEEVITTLEKARALLGDNAYNPQRMQVELELGQAYGLHGAYQEASACLEPVLAAAREQDEKLILAQALAQLARVGFYLGDYETSRGYLEEALPLAREVDDRAALVFILRQMANMQLENPIAKEYLIESLELARELGAHVDAATALNSLGIYTERQGDPEGAVAYYEEAAAMARELGNRGAVCMFVGNVGVTVLKLRDYEKAQRNLEESLGLARELHNDPLAAASLKGLAELYMRQDDDETAQRYFQESLKIDLASTAIPDKLWAMILHAALEARRTGDRLRSIEWLGMVLANAATGHDERKDAEEFLAELRADLPEVEVEAALERGKSLQLKEILHEQFGAERVAEFGAGVAG